MVAFVLDLDELLFFLGISLTIGYGLSFLLEKYGIPNVVIYILTGFVFSNFIIGSEITKTAEFKFWFHFVEFLALGLIGFKIGIEMEINLLRKHSRVISFLILFEVLGAFFMVFGITYFFTQSLLIAIILAGLATATAPAATIEVIRRLNADGPVTKKLKWILAFDDVVAILVVEAILSYIIVITLGEALSVSSYLIEIGREVGLAMLIGLVCGYLLDIVIERMDKTFQMMEITFASLILVMGVAHSLGTSIILSCMVVGMVTVNHEGNNFAKTEPYLDIILSPILIIFFLLVGAQITLAEFNPFPYLAVLYFLARSLGKIGGVYFGAGFAKTDEVTKNNVGLGLLPQGGVALGLTTLANDLLIEAGMAAIGEIILVTIVVSTIFSEGIGAISTSFASNVPERWAKVHR